MRAPLAATDPVIRRNQARYVYVMFAANSQTAALRALLRFLARPFMGAQS